jgi:hypothetical protein
MVVMFVSNLFRKPSIDASHQLLSVHKHGAIDNSFRLISLKIFYSETLG